MPTGYSISEGLAASIASLSSDTFTIDLPTTTAGTFAGTISFDNNDADENPYNFTVTGTITSPEVDLFEDATPIADGGGPIDFGSVLQGSAAPSKTFRVENNGDATLNTSNLTVPAGYSVTEPLATTLLPATSDTRSRLHSRRQPREPLRGRSVLRTTIRTKIPTTSRSREPW